MTMPDETLQALVHKVRVIQKVLVDKGIATTEELNEPPPEYNWLAKLFEERRKNQEEQKP